jgi:hypothetical protein
MKESNEGFHIAQANWARMLAPLDDPIMKEFADLLDPINALADESPGFVWRLAGEGGNSTSVRVFEDELILFNMSVWESIEELHAYVYRMRHIELIRGRGQWFETPDRAPGVLWWTPAGAIPTAQDGRDKLELLWAEGPTPAAFTFRDRFDPA